MCLSLIHIYAHARARGGAGLEARCTLVCAQQAVRVHKLRLPAAQGVHPDAAVMQDLFMAQKRAAHGLSLIHI